MRKHAWTLFLGLAAAGGQAQVQNTPSDEPQRDFARKLEQTLQAGDPAFLLQSLDVEALLDTAMRDLAAPAAMRDPFRGGAAEGARSLPPQVAEILKKGGQYRLLRLRPGPGGRPQALYRMVLGSGAVNYHEYALASRAGGPVRVVDIYVFFNGEWFSETLRRAWLGALAANGVKSQRLAAAEAEYFRHLPEIQAIHALQRKGQTREAYQAWAKLPAGLQASKTMLMERVQLAQALGEKEYGEAVEAFFRQFPTDSALDVLLVDAFLSKKDYEQCLATIARLDRSLGGDPYLDFLRGNVLYLKKDLAAAKGALGAAVAAEPTLVSPYWSLVTISLDERDYAETARLLTVLEKERGIEIADLKGQEPYAGFTASPAYKQWQKSRRR